MKWYVPYNRLGQKQLEVLNGVAAQLDQPHWVQGFAGTGKTLVVTHLMERVANLRPDASVCFITYTHALKDLVSSGMHGPIAQRVVIKTHTQFLSDRRTFDYVFLDEVQDISLADLNRIRSFATRLYMAGDGDQRIYDQRASDAEILQAIRPRTWKLLEVFRLTQLLARVAQAVLPRTRLIEGLHVARNAEVTVSLVRHVDSQSESAWVWREAHRRARPGEPSVILFPTHKAIRRFARELSECLEIDGPENVQKKDYAPFNEYWKEAGIDLMYFGNKHGQLSDAETRPLVFLMTYHSSKGLDFRNVFLPALGADAVIVHAEALEHDPDLDRRLLFVAVTRSRENLFISYSGRGPHKLLSGLPSEVVVNVDGSKMNKADNDQEEFF
jgi:superfamily I DNA/RNA helicase